jgi:hypothetical protein
VFGAYYRSLSQTEVKAMVAMSLPLRFHWHPADVQLLDAEAFSAISQYAEECGLESIAVPENLPASFAMAGRTTRKIKFLAQCGTGEIPEPCLVEQTGAFSELPPERVIICLPFDQLCDRVCRGGSGMEEYYSCVHELLGAYRRLAGWGPEIFVKGTSAEAAVLAIKFADCLWLSWKRPEQIYSDALPVLHMGKEAALCARLIARETAEEASEAARLSVNGWSENDRLFEDGPLLWTGPSEGTILTGSFVEIAGALMRYKEKGISQFLLSGPADQREMIYFAAGVLSIVRRLETG